MLIGGLFSKANVSGSLEYWGVCNFKESYPDFPKLKRIPLHEGSPVELLQEMFSVDPKMKVIQDADGRIRMIEEDVPNDLLDVKIHHLRFPSEYHGANIAVTVILRSPEVIAFRKEHNIGPENDWGDGIINFSSDAFAAGRPSVHGDLDDVTVREALDHVLLTFHGSWLYENCKTPDGGRTVWLGFFENEPIALDIKMFSPARR